MSGKVFRSGKYSGKSFVWVEENDPNYYEWVKLNRPEMLKVTSEKKSEIKKEDELPDEPISAIKPNLNFDNQKTVR